MLNTAAVDINLHGRAWRAKSTSTREQERAPVLLRMDVPKTSSAGDSERNKHFFIVSAFPSVSLGQNTEMSFSLERLH
jgi:hypothetical protein